MLAEGGHAPFDGEDWWFEPKLDGIRCLAQLSTGETILRTRSGRDATAQYPELHMVHELVDQVNCVLDGEIVAFDADGKNSFEALQQRMNLSNPREIDRARKRLPVSYVVFDLLWLDGNDVSGLPLEQRRELLGYVVEQDDRLRMTAHVAGDGVAMVEAARAQQLEGVMAKRLGSPYVQGRRTDAWRKIKLRTTQDCVILGFTPGQGGRGATFGALLVGAYDDDALRWVGQVGSGFTERELTRVLERLQPLARAEPAVDELRGVKGAVFVEPTLVCEVEYLEMTKSTGKMRAPTYRFLREDKTPDECVLERPR
jgi:bifunctional non-homologous end joining protein LigD